MNVSTRVTSLTKSKATVNDPAMKKQVGHIFYELPPVVESQIECLTARR